MSISNSQLLTWSSQGSITQSSTTYQTIKSSLESGNAPYSVHDYEVFLQGSYGNDTNIYAESDVDVVITLKECFSYDLDQLLDIQKTNFFTANPGTVTYDLSNFKTEVARWLSTRYGDAVTVGDKAITIAANGSRRKADVLPTIVHKRYTKFINYADNHFYEGIEFQNRAGIKIRNFPKQHSENLTIKHQATYNRFKPMVRILKTA